MFITTEVLIGMGILLVTAFILLVSFTLFLNSELDACEYDKEQLATTLRHHQQDTGDYTTQWYESDLRWQEQLDALNDHVTILQSELACARIELNGWQETNDVQERRIKSAQDSSDYWYQAWNKATGRACV